VIVGIAEQVEEDGLEEGESCGGLFGRWLVEKPEALVQNQAPGGGSGSRIWERISCLCCGSGSGAFLTPLYPAPG